MFSSPEGKLYLFIGLFLAGLILLQIIGISRKIKHAQAREAAIAAASPPAQGGQDGSPAAAPPKHPLRTLLGILAITAFAFLVVRNAIITDCGKIADPSVLPPSLPRLEAVLDNYLDIPDLEENLSGKLHGQAVVIAKNTGTLHPFTRMLPARLAAKRPEEVAIVIWIESENVFAYDLYPIPTTIMPWQTEPEESYKVPAYRAKWRVTVINYEEREIIARKSFVGDDPPCTSVEIVLDGEQWVVWDKGRTCEGCQVLFSEGDGGDKDVKIVGKGPGQEVLAWLESLIDN